MIETIIHQKFRTKEAAKVAARVYRRLAPSAFITIRRGKIFHFQYRSTQKQAQRVVMFLKAMVILNIEMNKT